LPPLTDPRHEAFAQARVRLMNRKAAYVHAGFAPHGSHGGKLEKKAEVKARIDELTALRGVILEADLEHTVAAILSLANSADALKSASGVKEALRARLEAYRLWGQLEREDAQKARPVERELTIDQWMAKHGPAAQGR
jgi:hypothetical protein